MAPPRVHGDGETTEDLEFRMEDGVSLLPVDHKPGTHRSVQEIGFSKVSFRDCTLRLLQVKGKKCAQGNMCKVLHAVIC